MKTTTKAASAVTAKPVKAPINLTLLTDTKSINKMIDSIGKRGKLLEKDIHTCAVSIVAHTEAHGDITLANRLIESITNIARKNALRDWFQAFGKFGFSLETRELTFDKSKKTDTASATANPFWEYKPEAAYTPFDLNESIQALIQRAESRAAKGDKRDHIQANKLAQLKQLFGKAVEAKAA